MTEPTQLIVVRSGRHPVVTCILLGLLAVALYSIPYDPPSRTLDLAFDYPERIFWAVLVGTGAAVTLRGLYTRRALHGLRIELAGWTMTVSGALVYITILIDVTGVAAAGVLLALAGGVAIGGTLRFGQIVRDLRRARV